MQYILKKGVYIEKNVRIWNGVLDYRYKFEDYYLLFPKFLKSPSF